MFHYWVSSLFLICWLLPGTPAQADDHLLTIGGGPNPEGNQVSLERNVVYLQRVLDRMKISDIEQRILFADGADPTPDLQFEADRDSEELRMLLAEMIGPADGMGVDYRSSSLPIVHGTAEFSSIDQSLRQLAETLSPDDRLIVYFTGHGGPPRGEAGSAAARGGRRGAPGAGRGRGPRRPSIPNNNILHLWNDGTMSVVEWTERLDELSADVPVVAVMVQCYSGGFGNFIFKGGNPANGLAPHPRCGFFSTVPDRVAAGCTPKVNEAEYREYSSYFFEALCGETRVGDQVSPPDYDQDGQTSFLEAHAYTVLTADTIDIPVRTSDVYLRQISSTTSREGLLTADSPISELLANADPVELAVIEGLSRRFKLTGENRATDVDEALQAQREEKRRIDSQSSRHRETVTAVKRAIGNAVKRRWPELSNPWHPETARIISEQHDQVRDKIIQHERYGALQEALRKIKEIAMESEAIEWDIVKLERLRYWLETRALSENLAVLGDADQSADLQRLIDLESRHLVPSLRLADAGH